MNSEISLDGSKILIVDDTIENVQLLNKLLEEKNYLISVATSGEDALEIVPRYKPDLILMDVMMPGIDGFETCRRLKENVETQRYPIIFLTAKSDLENITHGLKLGAVDYITKPMREEEVYARVSTHLELYKFTEHLETLVDKRTIDLKQSNEDLKIFTSSVAHDLAAPVRAIKGFSEIILEDYESALEEEAKQYFHRIHNASKKLGAMINGYIEIFRTIRQEDNWHIVNLSDIAESTLLSHQNENPDWSGDVSIMPGIETRGESYLFNVLIGNLLGNAFKYTSKVTEPVILFGVEKREGEPIYFVKDNGAGFDQNYADDVFKPFYRAHKSSEYDGSGIGLTVAQRIVRLHYGDIWLESEINKGTTVYFTLNTNK